MNGAGAAGAGLGRTADTPGRIPPRGLWQVIRRVVAGISADRVMLTAAGVTFYMLLALFPALAAFVSLYGFVADPTTIAEHIAFLGGFLPSAGIDLIETQLDALARQDTDALSVGFVLGLVIALWSANNGIKALFDAMNIVYREHERRGLLVYNFQALCFTMGGIAIGCAFLATVGVVPAILAALSLEAFTEDLLRYLRWPVLLMAVMLAISVIYRFGPSREHARWRWITWGSSLATVVWLASSAGFSWYLENFANYNATYGSLGAIVGFMMWTWISVVVLLVGAELNAELEHQTAQDTTTGPEQPLGSRGAYMADHVAPAD